MRLIASLLFLGGLLFTDSAALAQANQQKSLGQFRDWTAFLVRSSNILTCFAVSKPISSQPTGVNRDPSYFFVTSRPGDNTINETSIDIGYPFKEGTSVTVTIDGANFDFHTEKKNAWLTDIRQEEDFINKMKKGKMMVVKGISHRGTNTTDEYSLLGITAALNSVANNCK